jgi:hypothetical protein
VCSRRRSVYDVLWLLCSTQTCQKHGVIIPWSRENEFLLQHSSFNSWKPVVKLHLGEMCKLHFYFLSAVNTWLHIFINTDSIFGEIYIRFQLLCIVFLLLSTVNTLSIPYKCITKWKQTSTFSQLDRVYVPIRKKSINVQTSIRYKNI